MLNTEPVEIRAVVPAWVRDNIEAKRALASRNAGRRVAFAATAGDEMERQSRRTIVVGGQGAI